MTRPIELFEHQEFKKDPKEISPESLALLAANKESIIHRHKFVSDNKESDSECFSIESDEVKDKGSFKTSYFVGADWLIKNKQALYVQPKMNDEENEINYGDVF